MSARTLTDARDARQIIWDALEPLPPVMVTVGAALGRVLAEPVVSSADLPPFDNAAMDGFAVRTDDLAAVPSTLTVIGESAAGAVFRGSLAPGQAVRIMTGGAIPAGADAVIQQEWTESPGAGSVYVLRAAPRGHNIRAAGSDIRAGSEVLSAGAPVRPQEIGLLASLGRTVVSVSARPAAAVLSTGNELVSGGGPLAPGTIRDSNSPMLAALLEQEGCDAHSLGIARDDRVDLRRAIEVGLSRDILVTAGGVSVGAYDHVGDVLRELGVEIRFWKVNIRPGMPLLFGTRGRTAVFGLPGNPVSAMVTFLQFVRPALRRLKGHRDAGGGVRLRAALGEAVDKHDAKRHFLRGVLVDQDGGLVVRTTGPQVSNILSSLSLANCLIILPEEARTFRAGESVDVELL